MKTAYCLAVLKQGNADQEEIIIELNYEYMHAEKRLLEKLRQYFDDRTEEDRHKKMRIVLYCNYAPCNDCSDLILQFMEEYNINIHIKAVWRYHKNNEGLAKLLNTDGISLREFEENDWKMFHQYLQNSEAPGTLQKEWKPNEEMKERDKRAAREYKRLEPENYRQTRLEETMPVKKKFKLDFNEKSS